MPEYIDRLRRVVLAESRRLSEMPEETTRTSPAPGKWSPQEILGHLIDSASVNHERFLRTPFREDLDFPGYPQDAWVAMQGYSSASWAELITLWRAFNLHLARVMESIPETVRLREVQRHNFDEIAWRPVTPDRPMTLDYLMEDYVDHLEHHLRQITVS